MKSIIRAYILALLPALIGCKGDPGKPSGNKAPDKQAAPATPAAVTPEPQSVNFTKTKGNLFPDKNIVKAVSYSFLDVHDYELDSSNRGQLLMIMPNYDQYLKKDDPHPKVILTKAQTQRLLALINDPGIYSNTCAECYSPRNCFCFYNDRNEIVGWYELCFECGRIMSIPEFRLCKKGGLTDKGLDRLKQFCTSARITVNTQ